MVNNFNNPFLTLPFKRGGNKDGRNIMKNKGFTSLEFFKNFIGVEKNNQKTLTGFTLIELLVVIAIIGLLSSIVMVSLNTARIKARDTKRKADIRQIRLALEMYYDTNGRYPQAGGCAYGSNCYVFSTVGSSWLPALVGTYMSALPLDPKNNADGPWITGNYSYAYGNVDTNG